MPPASTPRHHLLDEPPAHGCPDDRPPGRQEVAPLPPTRHPPSCSLQSPVPPASPPPHPPGRWAPPPAATVLGPHHHWLRGRWCHPTWEAPLVAPRCRPVPTPSARAPGRPLRVWAPSGSTGARSLSPSWAVHPARAARLPRLLPHPSLSAPDIRVGYLRQPSARAQTQQRQSLSL